MESGEPGPQPPLVDTDPAAHAAADAAQAAAEAGAPGDTLVMAPPAEGAETTITPEATGTTEIGGDADPGNTAIGGVRRFMQNVSDRRAASQENRRVRDLAAATKDRTRAAEQLEAAQKAGRYRPERTPRGERAARRKGVRVAQALTSVPYRDKNYQSDAPLVDVNRPANEPWEGPDPASPKKPLDKATLRRQQQAGRVLRRAHDLSPVELARRAHDELDERVIELGGETDAPKPKNKTETLSPLGRPGRAEALSAELRRLAAEDPEEVGFSPFKNALEALRLLDAAVVQDQAKTTRDSGRVRLGGPYDGTTEPYGHTHIKRHLRNRDMGEEQRIAIAKALGLSVGPYRDPNYAARTKDIRPPVGASFPERATILDFDWDMEKGHFVDHQGRQVPDSQVDYARSQIAAKYIADYSPGMRENFFSGLAERVLEQAHGSGTLNVQMNSGPDADPVEERGRITLMGQMARALGYDVGETTPFLDSDGKMWLVMTVTKGEGMDENLDMPFPSDVAAAAAASRRGRRGNVDPATDPSQPNSDPNNGQNVDRGPQVAQVVAGIDAAASAAQIKAQAEQAAEQYFNSRGEPNPDRNGAEWKTVRTAATRAQLAQEWGIPITDFETVANNPVVKDWLDKFDHAYHS